MARSPGDPVGLRSFVLALCSDVAGDMNFESRFRSGHQDLHRFFWQLSQDAKTRCFVSGLLFDTNGNYPYSADIDGLFQELQLSGLLARPNPTYRFNDITFSTRLYAEDLKKELSQDEKEVFGSIVEAFKRELCVPQNA